MASGEFAGARRRARPDRARQPRRAAGAGGWIEALDRQPAPGGSRNGSQTRAAARGIRPQGVVAEVPGPELVTNFPPGPQYRNFVVIVVIVVSPLCHKELRRAFSNHWCLFICHGGLAPIRQVGLERFQGLDEAASPRDGGSGPGVFCGDLEGLSVGTFW